MSDAIHRRLVAVGEELATAIGDMLGAAMVVAPAEARHDSGWVATLTAAGEHAGRLVIALEGVAAAHLSRRLAGADEASSAAGERTGELLRDAVVRAASAMADRDTDECLTLTLDSVEQRARLESHAGAVTLSFALSGLEAPIPLALTWLPAAGRSAAAAAPPGRLDVILDIDLPVVVRFGNTQMPIRALSRLGPGSVIELGRSPDDPVEVLVSNRVVARGEVVIVGGNYGVRILDVTSQSERARSMEE